MELRDVEEGLMLITIHHPKGAKSFLAVLGEHVMLLKTKIELN